MKTKHENALIALAELLLSKNEEVETIVAMIIIVEEGQDNE